MRASTIGEAESWLWVASKQLSVLRSVSVSTGRVLLGVGREKHHHGTRTRDLHCLIYHATRASPVPVSGSLFPTISPTFHLRGERAGRGGERCNSRRGYVDAAGSIASQDIKYSQMGLREAENLSFPTSTRIFTIFFQRMGWMLGQVEVLKFV